MMKFPKVEIEKVELKNSGYVRGKSRWYASTLYGYVDELKLKPFKFPLACFDLTIEQKWMENFNCKMFVEECQRVYLCDTDIPIIFDDLGQIADGYHRIFKSLIMKKTCIMAYRLPNMPPSDRTDETKE